MKYAIVFSIISLSILALVMIAFACFKRTNTNATPVMSEGMEIVAITPDGTIRITAGTDYERTYAWNECQGMLNLLPMIPTPGSRRTGIYWPGGGSDWQTCAGISRAVVEEGQQHFRSLEEFYAWVDSYRYLRYVYRNDGLMVGWKLVPDREQISIEIWQNIVGGKKPQNLEGANDRGIFVKQAGPAQPKVYDINQDLLASIETREPKKVTELLAKGADPNAKDGQGRSALMNAALSGQPDIIDLLIAKSAKINEFDNGGGTALVYATMVNHGRIVKTLIDAGAEANKGEINGFPAIVFAAMGGNHDIVQALLNGGADANIKDSYGTTPLIWAASRGHSDVVKDLLKAGADPSAKDANEATALDYAKEYPEIESLLKNATKK